MASVECEQMLEQVVADAIKKRNKQAVYEKDDACSNASLMASDCTFSGTQTLLSDSGDSLQKSYASSDVSTVTSTYTTTDDDEEGEQGEEEYEGIDAEIDQFAEEQAEKFLPQYIINYGNPFDSSAAREIANPNYPCSEQVSPGNIAEELSEGANEAEECETSQIREVTKSFQYWRATEIDADDDSICGYVSEDNVEENDSEADSAPVSDSEAGNFVDIEENDVVGDCDYEEEFCASEDVEEDLSVAAAEVYEAAPQIQPQQQQQQMFYAYYAPRTEPQNNSPIVVHCGGYKIVVYGGKVQQLPYQYSRLWNNYYNYAPYYY